jgi:hypothetical protein
MCGVDNREAGKFFGEFIQHEDRIGGADRDAGAAIDAIVGLNVKLWRFGETGLILLGVDAVHRAGLHAQFILGTGIGNYVCHGGSMCNSHASAKQKKTRGATQQMRAFGWGIPRNEEASSRSTLARLGSEAQGWKAAYPTRALRPAGGAISLRAGLRSAVAVVAVRRRT